MCAGWRCQPVGIGHAQCGGDKIHASLHTKYHTVVVSISDIAHLQRIIRTLVAQWGGISVQKRRMRGLECRVPYSLSQVRLIHVLGSSLRTVGPLSSKSSYIHIDAGANAYTHMVSCVRHGKWSKLLGLRVYPGDVCTSLLDTTCDSPRYTPW